MDNNLVKNYFYIIAYQLVTIVTPLFTTPYVSRVLGPEKIGVDAYVYSYVQLFMLIVLLGLPTYASKKIAQASSKNAERIIFSELFSFQLLLTVVTIFLYGLFIIFFKKYQILFGLYSFTIVSTGVDTSWYFVGKEKISSVMTRNIIVRLLTVVAILTLVNTSEDLWKFVLISGCSLFMGQVVTGGLVFKEINGFVFNIKAIIKHSTPIFILFIVPGMTIFSLSISKILLGYWNGEVQVGMYNQAYKLYVMVISFISAITSVLMPRMSRDFSNNNHNEIRRFLHFSIRLISATAIPLSIGIIIVSKQFIPWFFGNDFTLVAPILSIISISFVIKGLTDILGIQYLVVANKNKEYAFSVAVGSISNLLVCYLLLSLDYQALSLAIGLLVGTLFSLVIELIYARYAYSFLFVLKCLIKYGFFSILMGIGIYLVPTHSIKTINSLVIQLIVGIIIYFTLLAISSDPLMKLIKKREKGGIK